MLTKFEIQTNKNQEIIDITEKIKEIVEKSEIQEGICIIHTAHTTTGILINEISERNLCKDILEKLEDLIPESNYHHNQFDNNAHSHIKASLIGSSKPLIISKGEIILGTWQRISLAEFDGPRTRQIFVKIIKG